MLFRWNSYSVEMVASTAVNRASTSLFHLRSLVLLSEPEMEAAVNRAML